MPAQKGLAPIVIVILLAVLGVGGFIFYQAYPHGKIQCDHSEGQIFSVINNNCVFTGCTQEAKLCPDGSSVGRSGPNCEFAPCPTPKESTSSAARLIPNGTGDTSKWKTYHAKEFSIQYPANWVVTNQPNDHFGFKSQDLKDGGSYELVKGIRMYINVPGPYPYGNTIDTYAKSLFLDCAKAEKVEDIYIGGYKARKYKTLCPASDPNTTDILIEKEGEVYLIGYSYQPSSNIGYLQTINTILSTFKFLP